jgi:crotonobetainyl-CoA:carnitine CoA-transferase CaiB-like acyl-CoA transferase
VRTGPSVMDMMTGVMTVSAVLAALYAREQLGHGQLVETALFDTAVNMLGFHAMNYLVSGQEPTRFGNNSRDTVPCNAFETADAPIFIDCANDRTWHRMAAQVLERPDLAEHPDYAKTPERLRNRDTLIPIIAQSLRTMPRAFWLARMRAAGVPAGAINSIAEALASEGLAARGLVHAIPHSVVGSVPNIRLPFRLHETPLAAPTAAPGLSQHALEILSDVLEYDGERIRAVAGSGAVTLR